MNWFDAAPVALLSAAWLVLPGLPLSYAIGLRGIAAWALAPMTSIALIALTAIGMQWLGLPWSVFGPIVVSVGVAVLAGAVAVLLRKRFAVAREPDPPRVGVAAAVGLLPALVLGLITAVRAFGQPENISQTYDAVFHYNALAHIRDHHDASSLTIGSLGSPYMPESFYPAAWHDLASLVMLSSDADVVTVANVLSALIAVLVWPLSCMLLVRQLFGRSPGALAITGVLSIGFTQFPWDLLGFGVLWPNLLGLAILPVALAMVATLVGWAREDALGKARCWGLAPVAFVAAVFAHPNVLFSLVVLAVFPVGGALLVRAWRLGRARPVLGTIHGLLEVVGFAGLIYVVWLWVSTAAVFADIRDTRWPPFTTEWGAVRDVLLGATNQRAPLWLLSALVLIGVVALGRFGNLRWILPAHLATGALYLLTASINSDATQKFTGYWYNDSHRLAALLPVTGVPLAVAGILYVAKKIADRVPATRPAVRHTAEPAVEGAAEPAAEPVGNPAPAPAERRSWRSRLGATAAGRVLGSVTTVAVALTVVIALATGGLYTADRVERVGRYYTDPKLIRLLTPEMRTFFERVSHEIPPDALVVGNPFDGSVMLYALTGRKLLFPHFRGQFNDDQKLLARRLNKINRNPDVCAAVNRLGVDYLLIGGAAFRPRDGKWRFYRGLTDPRSGPGFELIASNGPGRLYRITACVAPTNAAG